MSNDNHLYEALSEIKERTARTEEKIDNLTENSKKIDTIKDIANSADRKAELANHRIDKIDRWLFAIGSTAALAVVGAMLNLVVL